MITPIQAARAESRNRRIALAVSPSEIADAIHDAKTLAVFELPVRVKRDGRWRSALVIFEAEDRDEARQQIAFFAAIPDGDAVRYDVRRLRSVRTKKLAR